MIVTNQISGLDRRGFNRDSNLSVIGEVPRIIMYAGMQQQLTNPIF